MNEPDPVGSSPEARERRAAAELLGRILAAYWLANRPPANEPPTGPAPAEPTLTTPTAETYDGR
jgi:hypothetical protein